MSSAVRPTIRAVAEGVVRIEVVLALPERAVTQVLELPAGATVADAVAASGIERDAGIDSSTLDAGIWSRRVPRETVLADGDRVELYRPLRRDPKDARRRRARRGQP